MHSVVRSLLSFVLPIIFTHHLISMQKITPFPKGIPEVRDYIIYKSFPYAFNKTDKPKIARDTIISLSLVDKTLNKLINTQETTQTIINNLSGGHNQDFFARQIATPRMINYLEKSAALYKRINRMKTKKINYLLEQGADINYSPQKNRPLLFKALKNYDSTQELLRHGVNQDVIYHKKTALRRMIENDNSRMTQLLLSYNPRNKCLPIAVFLQNHQIISSILVNQNIPQKELNEALGIALQKKDTETAMELIKAEAQLDIVIDEMKQTLADLDSINF